MPQAFEAYSLAESLGPPASRVWDSGLLLPGFFGQAGLSEAPVDLNVVRSMSVEPQDLPKPLRLRALGR